MKQYASGEMVQRQCAFAVLTEDWSLVATIQVEWPKPTYNSCSVGSDSLFWPLRNVSVTHTHTLTQVYT